MVLLEWSFTLSIQPYCGPLTEMSTGNISGGGVGSIGAQYVGLTTLPPPPSCATCHEIWELQFPGTVQACTGIVGDL
jgi:hypothetical protein